MERPDFGSRSFWKFVGDLLQRSGGQTVVRYREFLAVTIPTIGSTSDIRATRPSHRTALTLENGSACRVCAQSILAWVAILREDNSE